MKPRTPSILPLKTGVAAFCILIGGSLGCTMCQNPYDYAGPVRSGPYASGTMRQPASNYGGFAATEGAPGNAIASASNSGWSASGRPTAQMAAATEAEAVQGLPPEGMAAAPQQQIYR